MIPSQHLFIMCRHYSKGFTNLKQPSHTLGARHPKSHFVDEESGGAQRGKVTCGRSHSKGGAVCGSCQAQGFLSHSLLTTNQTIPTTSNCLGSPGSRLFLTMVHSPLTIAFIPFNPLIRPWPLCGCSLTHTILHTWLRRRQQVLVKIVTGGCRDGGLSEKGFSVAHCGQWPCVPADTLPQEQLLCSLPTVHPQHSDRPLPNLPQLPGGSITSDGCAWL